MPIVVVCPCGAKLKAPDAAAGKRVKCPKCASPLAVPAVEADFEVIDDAPPPVATPAKKKPMLVDDDDDDAPRPAKRSKPAPVEVNEAVDDDDEVEDEAPKKKRRREDDDEEDAPKKKGKKGKGKGKKEQAKSKLPLILGIGGGVFVLLTVVGIIVGVMMSGSGGQAKGTTQAPPTKPALPPGWSEFKGEGFSVAVPDAVQFKKQEQGANPNAPRPPADTNVYTNGVQPQPQPNGPPIYIYVVSVAPLPPAAAAEFAKSPEAGWEAIKKAGGAGAQLQNEKVIQVAGAEGRQFTLNAGFVAGVVRVLVKGEKVYSWAVMSQVAPTEDAPEVKPFFDTFKIE